MILERLAELPVNIVAIEDPVEKHIRGISQMQVNTQAGLTFETGLRAALRQDPDVIMVGETRDSQTLKTSVRAAVTGHLVLSTLHTNNAAGTVVRMLDMGAEPYLAASSLSGILASSVFVGGALLQLISGALLSFAQQAGLSQPWTWAFAPLALLSAVSALAAWLLPETFVDKK